MRFYVDDVCAFVVALLYGVTFRKTQTVSRCKCTKTLFYAIVVAFSSLLATFICPWRCTPTRTTRGVASCDKMCKVAPNPKPSNYTKRRFFAVSVSENTGETLLRTYKKALFGAFWHLRGQTKGAKGGEVERWRGAAPAQPERLNASTPERTDNSTNNLQNERKDNRRGKFSTPGVVERRGGGSYPAYNARYENRK